MMAESGYEYDPLRRYQPQAPYADQPYASYGLSSDPLNILDQRSMPNGAPYNEPYNQRRHVIPGLGLGFTNNTSDWQNSQNGTMQSQTFYDTTDQMIASGVPTENPALTTEVQQRIASDDQFEDGEVQEEKMTDDYEPQEMVDAPVTTRNLQDQNGNAFSAHVHDVEKYVGPSLTHSTARERSGSYSPYLSPHEMDQQQQADPPIGAFGHVAGRNGSPLKSQMPTQAVRPHSQVSKFLDAETVTEARKQARDAILRLWPLNVRYQNYLDEGIDDGLLKSLFSELGFDVRPKAFTAPAPAPKLDDGSSGQVTDGSARVKEANAALGKPPGTKPNLDKAQKQDRSEERKDRIARLLAAKTSKPIASSPQPPQPPQAADSPQIPQYSQPSQPPPPPPSHPPMKPDSTTTTRSATQAMSQSEKSKLLHQKMEALRKAREVRGQKRPHPEDPERAAELPNLTVEPDMTSSSSTTSDGIAKVKDPAESSAAQNERADASPITIDQHALPIPGLFLSSTPQPSPTLQAAPGRHSAPMTVEPDERPFKRPFGQTREPRPFLIHVSDDEDDAEMDIDSPEHISSSTYRPASPSVRTMSAKGAHPLGENGFVRQYSNPIRTPLGTNGDGCTKEDLDNMHKEIEAMKQKILEAEARKKAKISRPESEVSTPSNGQAQGSGLESVENIIHIALPPPLSPAIIVPVISPSLAQPLSEPSPPQEMQNVLALHDLPMRRSLSRTATERLPLLEARRKEQQLRLKLLQSQMAGIEKEIQESLQEEERLKEDVEVVVLHDEEEKQATDFAVLASVESPALLDTSKRVSSNDAMDTTSMSSASSDEATQSRHPTPILAQGPPRQPKTSSPKPSNPEDASTIEVASSSKSLIDVTDGTAAIADIVSTPSSNDVIAPSLSEAQVVGVQKDDSSNGDLKDASDSYEPPEADSSSPPSDPSQALSPGNVIPTDQHVDESEKISPLTNSASIQSQQISTAEDDTAPEMRREVEDPKETMAPDEGETRTGFEDYETPLQHFNAYRFHRQFNRSVAGGLRSLTYSNKVDVKRELCPDDLAGRPCPRGKECQYQHFETMQAPDDQILLQLGAFSAFDEKQKQEYNTGLRQLLIDFRINKVKDFNAISQGILNYRARFLGDESKILPLGNITI